MSPRPVRYLRCICPACGRELAALPVPSGDGRALRVLNHRTRPAGTGEHAPCPGSRRLVQAQDCWPPGSRKVSCDQGGD